MVAATVVPDIALRALRTLAMARAWRGEV